MDTACAIVDHAVETQRLAKLSCLGLLDSAPEQEFDAIARLAKAVLDCPMAAVSLVAERRQWLKAGAGVDVVEIPRSDAFCPHALTASDMMVVEDAAADPRFAANPLVTGPPHLRFYAGVPLRPTVPGFADDLPGIGTLCVLDTKPRTFGADERALLRDLAALVVATIHARLAAAASLRLSEESHAQAAALARKQRQLLQAERMAGIGSWRLDLADNGVEWSDQVFAIHDLPPGRPPTLEEAVGFYPPDHQRRVETAIERAVNHGEPFAFDTDLITAMGRRRRVRSLGEAEIVDGRALAVIGVFQDITDAHEREEALRQTAATDALTGLPNRGCFETRLDAAMRRARDCHEPLALLILDLDGFKAVNDGLGHEAGDEVLRAMAARLQGRDVAHAFAARLGGDEFVMIVTRPRDCATIQTFIGTLLRRLRYDVVRDGTMKRVSATIGAALLDAADDAAGLLRRADIALYDAKRFRRSTGRIHGRDVPILTRAARDAGHLAVVR